MDKIYAHNATVSWNEHSGLDPNEFVNYKILLTDDLSSTTGRTSTTSDTSITIDNLEKNTKYEVCVRVVTHSFGESECSNRIIIRTFVESDEDLTALEKFLDNNFVSSKLLNITIFE